MQLNYDFTSFPWLILRNQLFRRESRVSKHSQKVVTWATPMFYKENEFQRKMEEKKMAKLAEDLERLRLRVAETDSKLKEKKQERAEENHCCC